MRKAGGVKRGIAVQALFMHQDGNTQPRFGHRMFLQRIDEADGPAHVAAHHLTRRGRSFGIRWPRELADAVGEFGGKFDWIKLAFGIKNFGF